MPDPLFGRSTELDALRSVFEAGEAAAPSCLLVRGQAGVGKSAVVDEALKTLPDDRTLLRGQAWSLDAELAYASMVDALRPLTRDKDMVAHADGLDDLGHLFPTLPLNPPTALGDRGMERMRLFESVGSWLERVAEDKPFVLYLEDLHAADRSSRDLFLYQARRLAHAPVTMVATQRPHPELDGLTEPMVEAGLIQRLPVGRMTSAEVTEIATNHLGGTPGPKLLRYLEDKARGVPLYVVGLIRVLSGSNRLVSIDGRIELAAHAEREAPEGLIDLVIQRFRATSPKRRRVLEVLAVAGGPLGLELMELVSKLPRDDLETTLRELQERMLVDESRAGWRFSHPLIGEAILGETPKSAQQQQHVAFIEARERLAPDEIGELARHYRRAGPAVDEGRAIEVLLAAGDHAWAQLGHEEAVECYLRLRELLGEHVDQSDDERLAMVLERLGDGLEGLQDREGACEVWKRAAELHASHGDHDAAGKLLARVVETRWVLSQTDEAWGVLEEGLELVDGTKPSRGLGDLHRALFFVDLRSKSRADLSDKWLDRLEVWREAGDEFAAEACQARFSWLQAERDYRGALRVLREGADRTKAPADRLRLMRQVCTVGTLYCYPQFRQDAADYLELAQELRLPAAEVHARYLNASLALWDLELERAAAEDDEVLRMAERIGDLRSLIVVTSVRSMVSSFLGSIDEALELARRAQRLADQVPGADLHTVYDPIKALLTAEAAAENHALVVERLTPQVPIDPGTALGFARSYILGGHPAGAVAIRDRMRALAPGLEFPDAIAHAIDGMLGDADASDRAVDLIHKVEPKFARLTVLVAAAEVGHARAEEYGRAALALAEPTGVKPLIARAKAALRALGVKPAAPGKVKGELSEREREVVELAAKGLTNAQIGKQLFISPHTVATHLKKVYPRLGVKTRAELASWLVSQRDAGG